MRKFNIDKAINVASAVLSSAVLATATVALVAAFAGCKSAPPIVLHEYSYIGSVREFENRAIDTIRAYGCEVDEIEYGCRNGTFIPVTVIGRRRTYEEIYRERMRKAEAELAEIKKGKESSNE